MKASHNKKRTLDKLHILDEDGRRNYIYPADVSGFYNSLKPVIFTILVIIYLSLPWLTFGGHQAILLDVNHRQFFLFGWVFNAQDTYLLFFLLSGIGFSLILITALFGRLWCGYACPQTVFLEGVFRRVERWIEGNHTQRMKLKNAPWTLNKITKKLLKHVIYLAIAFILANAALPYFFPRRDVVEMIMQSPLHQPVIFVWMLILSGVVYFNFFWFREQFCLIMCPYGRLQSAMCDRDTLIIGYDKLQGEPRGKVGTLGAGDCVDCARCVNVCPTGIDIRNGLQMECIGCANCVDACNAVMTKLGRKKGLIRYDSLNGLEGQHVRFWRPRVYIYLVAMLIGASVTSWFLWHREGFTANLLRPKGALPYIVDDSHVRNQVMLHVVNKSADGAIFEISADTEGDKRVRIQIPMRKVELQGFREVMVPLIIEVDGTHVDLDTNVMVHVKKQGTSYVKKIAVPVLGPL